MLISMMSFTVSADEAVSQVKLSDTNLTFRTGETVTLTATVLPEEATNKTVYFSSTSSAIKLSNQSYDESTGISSVDVTASEVVTGTIVAMSQSGYHTATCSVTVTENIGVGDVVNQTLTGGTYESDAKFDSVYPLSNAFDNNRDTKISTSATSLWIQFKFDNSVSYPINQYCIVSGDGDTSYDPSDWEFLGSNNGIDWDVLDTRSGEEFEGRKLKREFNIENDVKYVYYRLNITNNGGALTQLSEIQLYELGDYPSHWALGPFEKLDEYNPILKPNNEDVFFDPVNQETVYWSEGHLYNPAAVVKDGVINVMYRSQDKPLVSRVGLATSTDGVTFTRNVEPVLYPDNDFMLDYELGGGCEDPRVVKREDGTYVMMYSSYNRVKGICRLSVATSPDLLNWTKEGLAFNDAYNGKYRDKWSKSGSIICDMVGEEMIAHKFEDGKYWMYWGEGELYLAYSDDLITWYPLEDEMGNLVIVLAPRAGYFDSRLVEPGPPAIYTEKGVLLIYNGANANPTSSGDPMIIYNAYTPGQALFDNDDLTKCIERSEAHFMYTEKDYELEGLVNNVCFVEGLVFYKNSWFLYYGTADSRLAVAKFTPDAVNKDELKAAIDKAEAIEDLSGYSNDSVAALEEALDIANAVYVSGIYRQSDVDEYTANLNDAIDDLGTIISCNITSDKDSYAVNETVTLTVTTPKNVLKLGFINENGKYIICNTVKTLIDGDAKIWTVTTKLGTKGRNRTISLLTKTADGELTNTGKSVSFDVGYSNAQPVLISAELTEDKTYKVNETFSFTVTTSLSVDKIMVYNENGKGIGQVSSSYTDSGDIRTWTVAVSVGSAGKRTFNIKASSYGTALETSIPVEVIITK